MIVSESPLKRGRRLYGHLCTMDDGQVIYLARRKHREIFRSGHSLISEAMVESQAAWALDETTIYGLRAKRIEFVGVRVIDTGDLYVTKLAFYMDLKKAKVRDYSDNGGARQRYLPLQYFAYQRGLVALNDRKIHA